MLAIKNLYMRIQIKGIACFLTLSMGIIFCIALSLGSSVFASILPEGLVIKDQFQPGYGMTVGKMQIVQGKVIITHSRIQGGFQAKNNIPLYRGDTIYTAKKGRARFMLNDGSVMTLASSTKLIINSSIYDPNRKRRSSFLSMNIGKARFWVTKLLAYKESNFKVKTSTSVAGVRGSDFIITATPSHTEVITLENTQLEVVSLAAPEEKPVVLSDFQKTHIEENGHIEDPIRIPVNEIKVLKQGLSLPGNSGTPVSNENEFIKEESKSTDESKTTDELKASDESNTLQPKAETILVPDDTLVAPDFTEEVDVELGSEMLILIETEQKETLDPQEKIIDQIREDGPPELPGMPGSP